MGRGARVDGCRKSCPPTGAQTLNQPAHRKSLYQLQYPVATSISLLVETGYSIILSLRYPHKITISISKLVIN